MSQSSDVTDLEHAYELLKQLAGLNVAPESALYALSVQSEAYLEFWYGYDSRRSLAPKAAVVTEWLRQAGFNQTKAKAMASLLRPENVPPGPRLMQQ